MNTIILLEVHTAHGTEPNINNFACGTVYCPEMTFLMTLYPTAKSVNAASNYNLYILPNCLTARIITSMTGRFFSSPTCKPAAFLTLP